MTDSDLPPLDPEIARLLADAAQAPEPYLASVTGAVRAGVERTLVLRGSGSPDGGDGAVAPRGGGALGDGARSLARAAAWKGAAIAGAVGLAVGSVGGYSVGTRTAPTAATTAAANSTATRVESRAPEATFDAEPREPASGDVQRTAPEASSAAPIAPTPSASMTARTPAPSPPIRSALRQEREQIDAAGAALRAGHFAEALAAAERHAQRFPDGQLAEEREIVAIEALIALGRRDAARARAQRFQRRFPSSPQRARIESLVGAP